MYRSKGEVKMTIKYRIEQDNQGSRTLWVIKHGRKVLSHHEYKSDAEREAQRYVEDDAWHAANRCLQLS